MRAQVIAADLKPSRLNFAGVCIQCDEKGCQSSACVAKHERSRWIVCRQCDGYMFTAEGDRCGCLGGLEETYHPGMPSLAPRRLSVVPDEPAVPDEPPAAPRGRVAPLVPGAQGSLAFDPEFAEYLAYKRAQRAAL
jgi:hypothetical protein